MEILLFVMTLVFIFLFAVVVRVLGTDRGYKVLFVALALFIVLKTYFGW